MNTMHRSEIFLNWLHGLSDRKAKARILTRIDRAEKENFGDTRSLGDGVSEMRIDYGPGYRVYYAQRKDAVYLLLIGGDKRSQERDIKKAKAVWRDMGGK